MSAVDMISRWCLGIAARRWPDEVRDDLVREWQAELGTLAGEPHGTWRRLHFAASLASSPPVTDENGVPLGWRENTPGIGPAMLPSVALLIAGLLTVAVASISRSLLDRLLEATTGLVFVDPLYERIDDTLFAVPPVLFCLAAGWWIGRRSPMAAAQAGRFGRAGSAAYAAIPIALVISVAVLSIGGEPLLLVSLAVALLVWVPATAALGVLTVRRAVSGHRRSAAAVGAFGALAVVALTTAAALVPAALAVDAGFAAGFRAAAGFLPGQVTDYSVLDRSMTDPALHTVQGAALLPMLLLPFTLLALAYGVSAARRRTVTAPATAAFPAVEPILDRQATRPALIAVGTACLVLATAAWAYTVALLTPAMSQVSEVAPMPGGDGELYLWVAELRWAAILLAVLGLSVAAAHRRSPLRAAVVLSVLLTVADSVLERADIHGASGLQIALTAGAVTTGAAWLAAGAPAPDTTVDRLVARKRLATVAVIAALCGPMLHLQGTPAVNHPFLPLGLPLTTATVAVLLAVLATVTALAVRLRPVARGAAVAVVAVPGLVLGGLGVYFGNGVDAEVATLGVLLALPLAVVVVAVMRRHRPRRRGLTTALWAGLTIAVAPVSIAVLYGVMVAAMFVPELLFGLAGTGYPADGLSVVPGALLVAVPLGAWVGGMLGRQAAVPPAVVPGTAPGLPGGLATGLTD
jgi:hypothetical protein